MRGRSFRAWTARAWGSGGSLAVSGAILMAGSLLWLERPAGSADHLDPPERTNVGASSDVASDIADVFIWNDASSIKLAVTGAGPQPQGVSPVYDRDVVTRIHLSDDGDALTDEAVIDVRYGRNAAGEWGVQLKGVPGTSAPIEGPVQTALSNGQGVQAEAGLFDDPFFFDLEGFNNTKSSGTLDIISNRNFFAGKNDTSVVIEFPRQAFEHAGKPVSVWAETRRIPAGTA